MNRAAQNPMRDTAEVVDFDAALLGACPPELRQELIDEATLLAQAFAPEGRSEQIKALAHSLTSGARDGEMDRGRARRLAAALRHLAGRSEA